MRSEATLSQMLSSGVLAVIRLAEADRVRPVVEAVLAGGVRCIEITMTVPGAIGHIESLAQAGYDGALIGAGTVRDAATADAVIDAGARFVVGPHLDLDVIRTCRARDVVVAPGCFTPTEIVTAWNAGAPLIKVFPAGVLGPGYFKNVLGPLPDVRLMPTGGVTIENAGTWIHAGAAAVAIGGDLLDREAIRAGRYDVLTERARRLVQNIQHARAS